MWLKYLARFIWIVKTADTRVLYPSRRVNLPEGKEEIVGHLPPGSIGPSCMETLHLQIDGHLSPDLTAKGDGLTEFASQLVMGALSERGGADPFQCEGIEGIREQGVLKILLQGGHRFGRTFLPRHRPEVQSFFGLGSTCGLIDRFGLFPEALPLFALVLALEFTASFVSDIAQLMKDTALISHAGAIYQR